MLSGILAAQLYVSYPTITLSRIPAQLDKNIDIYHVTKDTANPISHNDMASS